VAVGIRDLAGKCGTYASSNKNKGTYYGQAFVYVVTSISGYIICNGLMTLTFSSTVACTSLFAVPVGLIDVHHHLVETFVSLEIILMSSLVSSVHYLTLLSHSYNL
jgi:hypothetical protein